MLDIIIKPAAFMVLWILLGLFVKEVLNVTSYPYILLFGAINYVIVNFIYVVFIKGN